MIEEHGLCFVPGSVFGQGFERYFRLCYACSTEEVAEGMKLFVEAMEEYRGGQVR
jgi:aspartate/methionine/tyrosine aminotransferase